jgi:hypothetical protein
MKLFILSVLVAWGSVSSAQQAQAINMPIKCLYSKGSEHKEVACVDYRLESKSAVNGACVFDSNQWQYGKLSYDKTGKLVFQAKFTCSRGIVMTPLQDPQVQSPHFAEMYDGSGKVVRAGEKYTSKVDPKEPTDDSIVVKCLSETSSGVPSAGFKACSAFPASPNHCWVKAMNTDSYSGKWWVQGARGSNSTTVCTGGVLLAKAAALAKDQREPVAVTQVRESTGAEFDNQFLTQLRSAKTEDDFRAINSSVPEYRLRAVTACIASTGAARPLTRFTCRNQSDSSSLSSLMPDLEFPAVDNAVDSTNYRGISNAQADCYLREAYPGGTVTYEFSKGATTYLHEISSATYLYKGYIKSGKPLVVGAAIRSAGDHKILATGAQPKLGIVVNGPDGAVPAKFADCQTVEYVIEKSVKP